MSTHTPEPWFVYMDDGCANKIVTSPHPQPVPTKGPIKLSFGCSP